MYPCIFIRRCVSIPTMFLFWNCAFWRLSTTFVIKYFFFRFLGGNTYFLFLTKCIFQSNFQTVLKRIGVFVSDVFLRIEINWVAVSILIFTSVRYSPAVHDKIYSSVLTNFYYPVKFGTNLRGIAFTRRFIFCITKINSIW